MITALTALCALCGCGLLTWRSARRVEAARARLASLEPAAAAEAARQLHLATAELAARVDR